MTNTKLAAKRIGTALNDKTHKADSNPSSNTLGSINTAGQMTEIPKNGNRAGAMVAPSIMQMTIRQPHDR
ncbi:MAG TPA: hypothetical protein VL486_15245 [Verrucomicrobiae bacterium]|nr:hypothetical protein [Verrucomicrobiae bacterium]